MKKEKKIELKGALKALGIIVLIGMVCVGSVMGYATISHNDFTWSAGGVVFNSTGLYINSTNVVDINAGQTATLIVAASDSLHPERADYVCNGVDDQVEIQAAIDALPANGGKVILLEGCFNLSARLNGRSNLDIKGQGRYSTILEAVGEAWPPADAYEGMIYFTTKNNFEISHLYVKNTDDRGAYCVLANNCRDFTIHHITADGASDDAIAVGMDSRGWDISDCIAINAHYSGIEPDDGVNRGIVRNNIIHDCGEGINIHSHELTNPPYNIIVTGNVIYSCSDYGIILDNSGVAPYPSYNIIISNNVISDSIHSISLTDCKNITVRGNICDSRFTLRGITTTDTILEDITFSDNICTGLHIQGTFSPTEINTLTFENNIVHGGDHHYYDAGGIEGKNIKFKNNRFTDAYFTSISFKGVQNGEITGNIVTNSRVQPSGEPRKSSGIALVDDCSNIIVKNNRCYDDDSGNQKYGIYLDTSVNHCIISDNNLRGNNVAPFYFEDGVGGQATNLNGKMYNKYSDLFMDALAVSATHIRTNEDLSAATPITFTIDAQPDIPRTLSGHFDSHAQITEYDIEIIGVDAKGNIITETKDETDGWDWETNNAFATITSIKMTSRTGTGAGDTMDIGITDVLGLSNIIYETGDVFKIKKNNANAVVAGAQVNTIYDTYDMAVIGLGAGDDVTIWYKSNLNIVS